jgi:FkbM family methyltransferase
VSITGGGSSVDVRDVEYGGNPLAVRRLLLWLLSILPPAAVNRVQAFRHGHPVVRRITDRLTRWVRTDVVQIRTGPAEGLRIDASSGKLGYALGRNEPVVQERLVQLLRPGAVFYDVGANVGFFTLLGARLVGAEGSVYAFEPVPQLAATIRRNVGLNGFENVVVVPKAASSGQGRGRLVPTPDPTGTQVAFDAAGEIELVGIDELVQSGEIQPPTVMKIDVEGAELSVLRGARQTLQNYDPVVVCELHGTDAQFRELMEELGYAVEMLDDGGGTDNPHFLARPGR